MDGHLIAYEYGTGAVWGYVEASVEDIGVVLPEVDVYDEVPSWMNDDDVERLRSRAIRLEDGTTVDSLLHRGPRY